MHIRTLYVVLSPSLTQDVDHQDIFFERDIAERIATSRNDHPKDSYASDWKVVPMFSQDYWADKRRAGRARRKRLGYDP